MVKTCSTWPLLNKLCTLKNFEVGLRTPPFEVMMGSEDKLTIVLKGKMKYVQKGSSGTYFDHGQFEIKTFPIYAPP